MAQVSDPSPTTVGGAPPDMAGRVRTFDWASTPLGPMDGWPVELKTLVEFMLASRFPQAMVWGPDFTTIYNDAFRPILSDKPEALGRSFAEVWSEAWGDIGPLVRRAYAGEATFIEDFPLALERKGRLELTYFTFCYSPLKLADGTVAGMMDTVVETTEAVRARQDLKTVNDELRHRLKNNLATVQVIVRQTLKGQCGGEVIEAIEERLLALGAAHDLLFREGWTSADLGDVARGSLSALLGRITLSGPQVELGARATVGLSLALHELATNAAKYGALSNGDGRVELSWTIDAAAGLLRISWVERDGPPVVPPTRAGFGSRLIEMGLSPGCRVTREFRPTGLRAEIVAPVDELLTS